MAAKDFPTIGNWYRDFNQQLFEVVALDEADGLIEIQYFNGDIDELDFEAWYGVVAESVPPPEDWTGPFGEMEQDDLGYSDFTTQSSGYTVTVEEME
jgi:hypothetical protein